MVAGEAGSETSAVLRGSMAGKGVLVKVIIEELTEEDLCNR
jgi:hypothetical protein